MFERFLWESRSEGVRRESEKEGQVKCTWRAGDAVGTWGSVSHIGEPLMNPIECSLELPPPENERHLSTTRHPPLIEGLPSDVNSLPPLLGGTCPELRVLPLRQIQKRYKKASEA